MKTKVAEYRRAGWKVKISHSRVGVDGRGVPWEGSKHVLKSIEPRGGSTLVEMTSPEGEILSGRALCSLEDGFNHKKGIIIAMGRALGSAKAKQRAEKKAKSH